MAGGSFLEKVFPRPLQKVVGFADSRRAMNGTLRTTVIAAAAVIIIAALSCSRDENATDTEGAATLPWHRSPDAALAEAQEGGRLVVVDVYTDWCGWCKKLDKDTLSNPEVRAKLKEFTLLKLNADKHRNMAERYGVRGFPTTLVLDASGGLIARQPGYLPPKRYLEFLASATKEGP